MPIDPSLYPANWKALRVEILHRANGQCECTGQCGLHQPNLVLRRCTELQHTAARWAKGKIRLTLAHMCNCNPICADPSHILAMCQRCHLRVDRFKHAANRLRNQGKKRRDPATRQPNVILHSPGTATRQA